MKVIKLAQGIAAQELLEPAGIALREGKLVAFPTETVYGLGANALSSEAVEGIFRAKGRPSDNPLIVHIAERKDLEAIAQEISPVAEQLMNKFWPGPLTLIFPRQPQIPDQVTAGLDTVAVRMPAHPVALALIKAAGVPIAAPSANLSGKPSPTMAEHVLDDLDGRIEYLIDGGSVGVGLESTVLDLTHSPPAILRPGSVTKEALEVVVGQVLEAYDIQEAHIPKAPGMKYTHYSPDAEVYLVEGTNISSIGEKMLALFESMEQGPVGLMLSTELHDYVKGHIGAINPSLIHVLGSRAELPSIAAGIYRSLRSFDKQGAKVVLVEAFPASGVGAAIMNRLKKAAVKTIK